MYVPTVPVTLLGTVIPGLLVPTAPFHIPLPVHEVAPVDEKEMLEAPPWVIEFGEKSFKVTVGGVIHDDPFQTFAKL